MSLYIATCTEVKKNAGKYRMDHLHYINKHSNLKWRHPNTPEDMLFKSIIICNIEID